MEPEEWKIEARRRFPELGAVVNQSENPYVLWLELVRIFDKAYKQKDEDLIRQIFEYGDWCISQPQRELASEDLATCVSVCFFEHIPENPLSRADMTRWFTLDDFLAMEQTFGANISAEELMELRQSFENKT